MATQVENGKAFEWATALALSDESNVEILETSEAIVARECFHKIAQPLRDRFTKAATLSCSHILSKESNHPSVQRPRLIRLASDSNGQKGDVRDVVLLGDDKAELGISCKTNHDAFKHPRLSGSLDFVKSWGLDDSGCSADYWRTASPIFQELKQIRLDSKATALWEDQTNTHTDYYKPLLEAFQNEILRLTAAGTPTAKAATKALVDYVIGINDFYKVICRPDTVHIEGFNLQGSLSISRTSYPEFCIAVDDFDGGAFSKTVRLQKGMTFDFRLHTASKRVEPSFKFDVRAIGLPSEVYQNHISLNSLIT